MSKVFELPTVCPQLPPPFCFRGATTAGYVWHTHVAHLHGQDRERIKKADQLFVSWAKPFLEKAYNCATPVSLDLGGSPVSIH